MTAAALQGCLAHLARSDAALVLVDLEELVGRARAAERPGHRARGRRTGGGAAPAPSRRSARRPGSVGDVLATVRAGIRRPREVDPSGLPAAERAHRRGPLSVQRGHAPQLWPRSWAPTPLPGRRVPRFAVWAPERAAPSASSATSTPGMPTPTPSCPAASRGSGRAVVAEAKRRRRLQVRHHHRRRGSVLEKADPFALLHRGSAAHRLGRLGPRLRVGRRRVDGARGVGTSRSTRPCRSTRSTWGVGGATPVRSRRLS